MSLSDLILLLRHDIKQAFRVRSVKGKRTKKRSKLRSLFPLILIAIIVIVIVWGILTVVPLIGWTVLEGIIADNLGAVAALFNAILVFSSIGSIWISATTVGNSSKMEYLLIMPLSMRTIFLEKTILVILYSSAIWMIIGIPIFVGLGIVSTAPLALLAAPIFAMLVVMLVMIGVSLGGLSGLAVSRLLAGRRVLKQVGYAVMTALGIIGGIFWYYSFYFQEEFVFIGQILALAEVLGFTSVISPGYTVSSLSLGLLVAAPLHIQDFVSILIFIVFAIGLAYATGYISERAHYSGWLASGAKRTPKEIEPTLHLSWNLRPIPILRTSITTSVSYWYNITNVRREARVLVNYLLNPLRFAIWFVLPVVAFGETMIIYAPYLLLALLIPFATSYGVYFAGYETVYEGRNIMNLQLAAANMQDYVKGKVLSAIPFSVTASAIISVIVFIISPSLWPYLLAIALSCAFITMASGSIAANAAAMGGDFKAERMVTRQRGAAVQMPIRGWSMFRAHLIPNLVGYFGVFSMFGLGMFVGAMYGELFGVLIACAILPLFAFACYKLYSHYSYSAGLKLAQLEASEYL